MNKELQISFVGYGYVPTQRDYNQSFRVDLRIGQDLPLDLTIGSYVKFQTIDIQLRHLKDGIFQVTDIVGRRLLLQLRSFSSTISESNMRELTRLTQKRWGVDVSVGSSITYSPLNLFGNFSNIMNVSGELSSILKNPYVGL